MRLIVCLLILLAVLGCGPSLEQKVVGTWKVDIAKSSFTGEKVKTEAEKKQQDLNLGTYAIELRADKTCELLVLFPRQAQWALNGSKMTITPKERTGQFSFNGRDTMELDVSPSGDSMSAPVDSNGLKGTIVFAKSPS